jgi:hypothetical protein
MHGGGLTAFKPHTGQLGVWWATTCESRLLYVFAHRFFFIHCGNTLRDEILYLI